MRWLMAAIAVVGCKGGNKAASGGGSAAPGTSAASAGPCKPMSGLCNRMPAAELGKLFEAPALAGSGADHDDAPMGPMDECTYTAEDDKITFKLMLRYQCWSDAAANYKGTKGAVAGAGGTIEDLSGLGDEAYWFYSSSNVGFVQGHIKARRGAAIFDIAIDNYRVGQNQIDPAIAKQRALETAKRFLAASP